MQLGINNENNLLRKYINNEEEENGSPGPPKLKFLPLLRKHISRNKEDWEVMVHQNSSL